MTSCLFGSLSLFSALVAQKEDPVDFRTELRQIDDEIKRSEDARNRYLAAARRHEDDGMRWQFQQNQKQEARRAYEKADAERQAAKMLQARIDALNARKRQLLKEHPELNPG